MKPISEHPAIERIKKIYDLDSPSVNVLKKTGSTFFANLSRHSHVHELLWLKIGNRHFLAKGEDVFLRLSHPHVLDYSNLYGFSSSLFKLGDYTTPEKTFRFPEEPEIKDISFSANEILSKISTIRSIEDETPISSIEDPLIRKLFIFYLSRKEKLLEIDGQLYENVFNHRGRDILSEVIASILAKFLKVRVPNNFFGVKTISYSRPAAAGGKKTCSAKSRYVLSELLTEGLNCPSLDVALCKMARSGCIRSEYSFRFPSYLTNANPLGIRHFSSLSTPEHRDKRNLILSQFPHYPDLIYSDFFDKLLGGWKDRKLQEYLLPEGPDGPIYTVDYGEILFPELEFEKEDRHYLDRRGRHITAFINYLDDVASLPNGNIYKTLIGQPVLLFAMLPRDFFMNIISTIPPQYFQSHWDDKRYAYRAETLIDFFEHLNYSLKNWLGSSDETDPDRLYCIIERAFS